MESMNAQRSDPEASRGRVGRSAARAAVKELRREMIEGRRREAICEVLLGTRSDALSICFKTSACEMRCICVHMRAAKCWTSAYKRAVKWMVPACGQEVRCPVSRLGIWSYLAGGQMRCLSFYARAVQCPVLILHATI
eukprot:2017497-Rhodomonas_salina.1